MRKESSDFPTIRLSGFLGSPANNPSSKGGGTPKSTFHDATSARPKKQKSLPRLSQVAP